MAGDIVFDTLMLLDSRWDGVGADVARTGVAGAVRVRRNGVTVFMDVATVPAGRAQLWYRVGCRVVDAVVASHEEAADFIEAALGPATGETTDGALRATGG